MKIAIIGCEYIGYPLAKLFNDKGYQITAMTKNVKDLKKLKNLSQKIIIYKKVTTEDLLPIVEYNDTIILSIPTDPHETYEETFLTMVNAIKKAASIVRQPKTIIYTSRSIVYGEQNGLWVDEAAVLHPTDKKEQVLIETEKTLLTLQQIGWSVCILRLSEVYGPSFEISKKIITRSDYFSTKSGDNYTNMVHLDDIISAINHCLSFKLEGIYNLTDDDHSTLKELLNLASKKLNLSEIKWDPKGFSAIGENQRVSNHKIKAAGYTFIHPNRLIS
jgi:nucleoside-diphosphate-sugar epimerase